jgi:hypothetical protein
MTLAEPAHCGVAGHLADRIPAVGDKRGPGTPACSCSRRFATRMATSDHNDIELISACVCHDSRSIHQLWINIKNRFVSRETFSSPKRSLSDAKAGENVIQKVFHIDLSNQLLENPDS